MRRSSHLAQTPREIAPRPDRVPAQGSIDLILLSNRWIVVPNIEP
jgi:hypothetical protein